MTTNENANIILALNTSELDDMIRRTEDQLAALQRLQLAASSLRSEIADLDDDAKAEALASIASHHVSLDHAIHNAAGIAGKAAAAACDIKHARIALEG